MSAVPPAHVDTSCLYSTVKNTSGGAMTFSFLPPHGQLLAADEEFTIFGDITSAMIKFERSEGRRSIIAFENALQHKYLTVISTPTPILHDAGNGTSKQLNLDSGTLGVVDMCWANSESISDPPLG